MLSVSMLRALLAALGCMALLALHVQAATIPFRASRQVIRAYDNWEGVDSSEINAPVQEPTSTQSDVYTLPWIPSSTAAPSTATSSTTTPSTAPAAGGSNSGGKADVLIPFYVYPGEGSVNWAPMEKLVTDNPNVKFTIIINPDNGPGGEQLPDNNWRKAVPKLASHSNVLVIGYVSTSWGNREISKVQRDIKTYAEWPTASGDSSFAVHGIFLDEGAAVASQTTEDYYKQVVSKIKGTTGLGSSPYVVMNPGTIPAAPYLDIPDVSVIFESSNSVFQQKISENAFDSLKSMDRSRLATMVTSVAPGSDVTGLISQLKSISGHVYFTNSASYLEYCSSWDELARAVATS
ncbi:hypothetical protein BBP40_002950 [Aspergillus hancockii]|nr:hypothetical protein BBP40_002950 [Aspergillus hancockii]